MEPNFCGTVLRVNWVLGLYKIVQNFELGVVWINLSQIIQGLKCYMSLSLSTLSDRLIDKSRRLEFIGK